MPQDRDVTDPRATEPTAIGTAETQAEASPRRSSRELPARYRPLGALGAGGMGEVLLAADTQIDREVAIKRMLIEPTGPAVARFLREAKVQGRLDHPAIVPVYELADDADGRPFFVMKRLVGTTLADVLARHTGDPRYTRQKLLRAFADACLAIELAHSRGVIHRDLKPANIMLGDYGEVYVLDWGIARVEGETDPTGMGTSGTSSELTQAGALLGTPGFIAPEMIEGKPIDSRADVFALGCILFEILAGEPMIPRRDAIAATITGYEPRPSLRAPDRDLPPELDAACAGAAARDPAARPTARALAEQVEHFLDGDRDLAQRKKLAEQHLATARAAAASGNGVAERGLAMREAGRALALDPTSDAADLLGRLMLEPPEEMPPEVETRLRERDQITRRTKSRFFFPTYVIGLVVTPFLAHLGLHTVGAIAFGLAATLNILSTGHAARATRPGIAALYLAAITNTILVVVSAYVFSPVLVAPSLALLTMLLFSSDTEMRMSWITILSLGAALAPCVIEMTGAIGHDLHSVHGDLVIHSPEFTFNLPDTFIAFTIFIAFATLSGGLATRQLALNEREALRKVELQAWHLRQLVGR